MKKKILALVLALVIAVLTFGLAACDNNDANIDTDSDLAYIKDKGVIVVGITDYPPMDYKDDNGEWIGFDADVARLYAEHLEVDIEFLVLADWGGKFNELNAKSIDCVWNGMTITDEAKLNSSVSNAYARNAQVVVMNKDALKNYTTVESLAGLTFAVEEGSAGEDAIIATFGTDVNYVESIDQANAVLEVQSGAVDACVIDLTMATATIGEGKSYADLAYNYELTSEEFGVSFRKDSDATADFNAFMAELKADGALDTLAEKYTVVLA